jgi:hypothetical protein
MGNMEAGKGRGGKTLKLLYSKQEATGYCIRRAFAKRGVQ